MTKAEKERLYCSNCRRNFLNKGGTCSFIEDAKLILAKEVPESLPPPWNVESIKVLDCYAKEGFFYI